MKYNKIYLIFALIILLFISMPAFAKNKKTIATVQEQINSQDILKGISFKIQTELILSEGKIIVPEGAILYAYILNTQNERRWHKSGFIVCKLKGYVVLNANNESYTDIEQDNIYIVARKYEAIDKKEVGKSVAKIAATTAASFVVPGANIAYYFTKGMMNKKEGKTRFKSGVSSVYENSIFWLWFKGKPIDLEENDNISFVEITEEKAQKLSEEIDKRNERLERMRERKENIKEFIDY